ncbi:hypothetical protein QR680_003134 [Steinernema hermaphroditum]|uniref:Uncharacterized protein n=1 Tax=Steinernema hermaphroditum TaxID=289476 RepID=A0AA39H5H5_9BILA|nr:hypothetical protein QR680_003134 [Steinernema hermaphroditum]
MILMELDNSVSHRCTSKPPSSNCKNTVSKATTQEAFTYEVSRRAITVPRDPFPRRTTYDNTFITTIKRKPIYRNGRLFFSLESTNQKPV